MTKWRKARPTVSLLLLNENIDFLASLGITFCPATNFHRGILLLRGLSRNGIVIWRQHLSRERISRGKQHSHFFSEGPAAALGMKMVILIWSRPHRAHTFTDLIHSTKFKEKNILLTDVFGAYTSCTINALAVERCWWREKYYFNWWPNYFWYQWY